MSTTIYLVKGSKGEYEDHCEWVIKAFTDQTAANLHAQQLTDDQTLFNSLVEKARAFQQEWLESNPLPEYPTDKFLPEKKWPSGMRNNQITLEMRNERVKIRAHNEAVQKEFADVRGEHHAREVAATNVYLASINTSPEMIEKITGTGWYMYERDVDYTVEDTQLD